MSEELTWTPGFELRERIVAGEVSPVEVTQHFLDRIEDLDPALHAFTVVDKDGALEQARALSHTAEPGPLHGVPVSLKAQIAVKGLPAEDPFGEPGRIPPYDDIGVSRLREAGAVIIGLNVSGLPPTPQTHPRNPWDTDRSPGWSSSGSASAAAAGLVPIAIGTDGAGSTRLPSAYTGLVGLHPTVGRIPTVDLELPGNRSMLFVTQGPMCRSVRDAATVLQVMAGPDGHDMFCLQDAPGDYLATVDDGVRGMRFAWTDELGSSREYAGPESDRVIGCIREAAQSLEQLGATVEPAAETWEDHWEPAGLIFAALPPVMERPPTTPEQWERGLRTRARNWERYMRVFGAYDLLLMPTAQRIAPTVDDLLAAAVRVDEGARSWPPTSASRHRSTRSPSPPSRSRAASSTGFRWGCRS